MTIVRGSVYSHNMHKTLTVTEAATRLGITRQAVLARIKSGNLRATKISSGVTSPYLIEIKDLPDVA